MLKHIFAKVCKQDILLFDYMLKHILLLSCLKSSLEGSMIHIYLNSSQRKGQDF